MGTVRSRLARARDTLRTRLTRRGVTAPLALGPMASWMIGDPAAPTASVATMSSVAIPRELVTAIARSVSRLASGRMTAVAAAPSASLLLAQGVLRSIMLKKMLIAFCAFLPVGIITIGGGVFLAQRSKAQDQKQPAAAVPRNEPATAKKDVPKTDDLTPLILQLLEAAPSVTKRRKPTTRRVVLRSTASSTRANSSSSLN